MHIVFSSASHAAVHSLFSKRLESSSKSLGSELHTSAAPEATKGKERRTPARMAPSMRASTSAACKQLLSGELLSLCCLRQQTAESGMSWEQA